ncbi:MAG: hypothetical protein Q4G09_03435 [Clostridia bacterium]|nr:hypothetical protein [Clostridia bacterium]
MELKKKLLLSCFKDNCYFKNLNEYLNDMVEQKDLSYENLKYLYLKMYINKSYFIRQNIYPVSQFLLNGYTTKEAEKIAELLPDANKFTIFCYEEKEVNYVYNKLFKDLEFAYYTYDKYVKENESKNTAFERLIEEINNTSLDQRSCEISLMKNDFTKKDDLETCYKSFEIEMDKLRKDFKENVSNDKKLVEHLKNNDSFTSIMVAGTILGGIDLRNMQRENDKLNGEVEKYPYNEEQIQMIDKYNRLQDTIDKIERFAELNNLEDEEEFE